MANVGLKTFLYAPLTEDGGAATYTAAKRLAGAIEAKFAIELNNAPIYHDDVLGFEDTSFKKGTITLGIDDDDDVIFAELLGQKIAAESVTLPGSAEPISVKKVTASNNDVPIPVGFGYITGKQVDAVKKYKVEFYKKVTFKPFKTDAKTKGESLEFVTPSIEGTVATIADGSWNVSATFDTVEQAVAYLEGLFTPVA